MADPRKKQDLSKKDEQLLVPRFFFCEPTSTANSVNIPLPPPPGDPPAMGTEVALAQLFVCGPSCKTVVALTATVSTATPSDNTTIQYAIHRDSLAGPVIYSTFDRLEERPFDLVHTVTLNHVDATPRCERTVYVLAARVVQPTILGTPTFSGAAAVIGPITFTATVYEIKNQCCRCSR
jgi:hypothetical protein